MDPTWLIRNVRNAWRYGASPSNAVKRLLLTYAGSMPSSFRGREWNIGFRYPSPVGSVQFRLRANDGADAFIHGEIYEHEYYRFNLPQQPRTILDLGANIGLTAVYFARRYPGASLACIEPSPGNFRLLNANLALNGVSAVTIEAAIDIEDGHVQLDTGYKDYGHKVAYGKVDDRGHLINVPSITMLSLIKKLDWSTIDLLKMDIEGHEWRLFSRDCDWLHFVQNLCIECHDDFENELPALAERYGFRPPERLPGIWLVTR